VGERRAQGNHDVVPPPVVPPVVPPVAPPVVPPVAPPVAPPVVPLGLLGVAEGLEPAGFGLELGGLLQPVTRKAATTNIASSFFTVQPTFLGSNRTKEIPSSQRGSSALLPFSCAESETGRGTPNKEGLAERLRGGQPLL